MKKKINKSISNEINCLAADCTSRNETLKKQRRNMQRLKKKMFK